MGVGLSFLVSCVGAMDVIGALGYITDGLVRRNHGYEYNDDGTATTDDGNLDGFRSDVKDSIGRAPTSRVDGVTVAQDGVRYKDGYRVDDNIDGKQLDALADRLKSLSEFAQGGNETPKSSEPLALEPKTIKPPTPEPEKSKTPEPVIIKPQTPDSEKLKTPEPDTIKPVPEKIKTPEMEAHTPKTPEFDNTFKPLQPELISTANDNIKSPSPTFIPATPSDKEKEDLISRPISPKPLVPETIDFIEEAKASEERNRMTPVIESVALQKSSTTADSRPLMIEIDNEKIPIAVATQLSNSPRPQTPMMEVTEPECVQRKFTPHFEAAKTDEPDSNLLNTPVMFADDGEKAGGSRHHRQRSESPTIRPIVRDDELRKTIKRSSFKSSASKEDREEELKMLSALEDEEMKSLEENFVPLVYTRTETELARHHPFNISPIMEGSSYATTSSDVDNSEETEKIPDMKNVDIPAPWSPQVAENPKQFNMVVKSKKLSIEEVDEDEMASEDDDEELKEIERISRQETQKWLDSEKFEHIDADRPENSSRSKRSAVFPTASSPTPSSGRNSPFLSPTQEPNSFEFLGSDEINALNRIKDHAKAVDQLSVGIRRERSKSPEVSDERLRRAGKSTDGVSYEKSEREELLAEIRGNKRALKNLDVGIGQERSRSRSRSSSPTRTPEMEVNGNPMDRLSPVTVQSHGSPTGEHLIFSGEYTKAMSKDWHSGHFCCWQCDESLTGQRYVLRDENPYCIKCYENVFANLCEECNKTIGIDSKDLSYKDKHWHEACFLCSKCRISLVDKQFGSKAEKIYCGNCYDNQFASRCDSCGEVFRAGTKKMEYKTRQWHEKCFCCCVCKTAIGTKSFIPREQEIYCAGCYEEKYATRCIKCDKIITSGGVTYKNEPWHRDCFTCTHCQTSLAGQRFTSRDDKPYCADCFGELFAKRCTACIKPITGIGGTRFISFEDRHWHNDCFICASCKTSLVGRGFITDETDIICPECAKQKLM